MEKRIYDADGNYRSVSNINAYLFDGPNVFVKSRPDPLFKVPRMIAGNRPVDGGNLIIEAKDLEEFLKRDPRAEKYIRKLVGGEEFINGKDRYCLWLVDVEPSEIRSMKNVLERVRACKQYRLSSKNAQTRKLAETPWLFREQLNPAQFIIVPKVSSERRDYIPMGFLDSETIVTDTVRIIPDGELWLFGILMSRVHMAWVKVVSGRLKSDYSYSAHVVYNNFPFHQPTPEIEATAQKILDVRKNYPNSSLADLYDPDLMPKDLRRAHEENDRAVLDAYEFPRNISDSEIVTNLFYVYEEISRDGKTNL